VRLAFFDDLSAGSIKWRNSMPVVHIYTAEGWVSPARKKLMIQKVTDAVVEAEGLPQVRDMTYVLVHDVADGGWGWQGHQLTKASFADKIAPDPDQV
jgi:4-oxalocrotonate tautomerase